MSEPLVLAEAEGPVLVVTINRPEKKNAANAEVLCRLYDAWVRLDTDRGDRQLPRPDPAVRPPEVRRHGHREAECLHVGGRQLRARPDHRPVQVVELG